MLRHSCHHPCSPGSSRPTESAAASPQTGRSCSRTESVHTPTRAHETSARYQKTNMTGRVRMREGQGEKYEIARKKKTWEGEDVSVSDERA